ncbi:hypothetical protein QWM81_23815 [Streptomyces ficellus]|uniref:Secreted protein n=1 Tax=Streptomyces ficellus TaxID=1977088 RepID=A0ABT7ZC70_9ACTN|nr:hypothetical protein [Streptomyces ficellus]MDN3297016.1 hypothetical protein [Streptomyces ficellus]
MNTTLWVVVACASACTALSALVPPPASRMWRVDTLELRRRRRSIEVLTANVRPAAHKPPRPNPAEDGQGRARP